MVNGMKLSKCADLMSLALNDQTQISSVQKEKKKDGLIFDCDFISAGGNKRKLYVMVDFLDQDRVDIKYRAIIDIGNHLDDEIGIALAGELNKKYRFVKNYTKKAVGNGKGKKENYFEAEYDCLLNLADQDIFIMSFADISKMYCNTLSDCIDIEQKIFDESKDEELVEQDFWGIHEIEYNPNPFV